MDLIKGQFCRAILVWNHTARSFDFEMTGMISDQIALHSVQLPLFINQPSEHQLNRLMLCEYQHCDKEKPRPRWQKSKWDKTVFSNGRINSLESLSTAGIFNIGLTSSLTKYREVYSTVPAHTCKHNKQLLIHNTIILKKNTIFLKHKSILVKHNTKLSKTQFNIRNGIDA